VLIALGAKGTGIAVAMLVIVLLANGLLQNIVSPFAMGATLDMNPLLNLAVTVGAGCLFGMFGLVLAAPLTSAALHIGRDLREQRVTEPPTAIPPEPLPGPVPSG
jgi:predicted PurR-regulated permease PerM